MNSPEYNPDIDGQLDPVTDIQAPNAETVKEDTPSDTSKSEHHIAFSSNTNRPEPQPLEVSADTDYPVYHDGEQPRAEHPIDYYPQLDDIPELETDKENWEEGQFEDAELIDCHSTTKESDRIRLEFSAHFKKVTDQEYSLYHSTTQGLNTRSLNQNITTQTPNQNSTRSIKTQTCISLPCHLLKIYVHSMVKDVEEPSI